LRQAGAEVVLSDLADLAAALRETGDGDD
jgi:hypothetical protein